MKSMTFRFFTAVAVALLGLVGITSSAMADTFCPSLAVKGGYSNAFNDVVGPLDATCGPNSAVTMSISSATDGYAKLTWDPVGFTLGSLGGLDANVTGQFGDQPFYMLAFTDNGDSFLDTTTGDQILMIEFQTSTVSGNSMDLNINTTQFNLFDNSRNCYLIPGTGCNASGQQDTNSLAGWIVADPLLGGDSLQEIRIGIGLAGPGDTNPAGVTVNALETVPEPTSLLLLLTLVGATGLGVRVKRLRNRRS